MRTHPRLRSPRVIGALCGAAAALALVVLPAGCGTSGRELRDPKPGATAPPRKAPPQGTLGSSTTLGTVFALSTDAWAPGGTIPKTYTCDGEDVSPPLVISKIPTGTAELAIVVTDPDADGFVHWVLAGIPPSVSSIEEGTVPSGAVQATTTNGVVGWSGPCPPTDSTHTYEFTVYALAGPSGVTEAESADAAVAAIGGTQQVAPPALLTGTVRR